MRDDCGMGCFLETPQVGATMAAALRPVLRSWRSLRMAADGTDMVHMVIDGQGILALGQNEDRSEIETSGPRFTPPPARARQMGRRRHTDT